MATFTEYTEATEAKLDTIMNETAEDWSWWNEVSEECKNTESENEALATLPPAAITALRSAGAEVKAYPKCRKCSGKGRIDSYSHIAGGVCFSCNGAGVKLPSWVWVQIAKEKKACR